MDKKIGILLTNTGTPDAPTPTAVREYLCEFLSDRHIVQLPRIIWLPILYGLILPTRSYKSAELYQKIWTTHGSPMRFIMQSLRNKLNEKMSIPIEIGMNYGNPSISNGLERLNKQNVDEIIILPLFPQYSNTTTQSSFDKVTTALKKHPNSPQISFIHDYAKDPRYIDALAANITDAWAQQSMSEHLLISFHGIPERFVKKGDPYQTQCEATASLLAEALQLPKDKWTLCYQSQFGYAKWLKPATFDLLATLPKQGIKEIDVVCPGFSVDCLETLEEISIRGRKIFLEAGGQSLRYIPALNVSNQHIDMLINILKDY